MLHVNGQYTQIEGKKQNKKRFPNLDPFTVSHPVSRSDWPTSVDNDVS